MRGIFQAQLLATAAIVATATATPALAQTRSFDVASQPAERGIPAFAKQAGVPILASGKFVAGKRTNSVKGNYSVEEGLRVLLRGTGLRASQPDAKTGFIAILPALTERQAENLDSYRDAITSEQAGATPEVLVVGLRNWTLNTDIKRTRDDAQPYVVFDREQIKRSGSTNLEEFFRDYLNAGVGNSLTTEENNPGALGGGINLRGLGADETLILVDGRRIAPTNTGLVEVIGQPQISGIPLGAIERIEVLASSAGGIYGSNATGGVINIILKRDYTGLELNGSIGGTYNGKALTRKLDFAAGTHVGTGTSITMTGSYQKTDPYYLKDADFIVDYLNQNLARTPTAVPLGATPNIRSSTGANLVLDAAYGGTSLGSAITSVPVGYRGVALDGVAGLVANAGRFNLDLAQTAQADRATERQILNGNETVSGSIAVRSEVTPWLKIFSEASGSQTKMQSTYSSVLNQTITLAANAPNNPFQQAIIVNFPIYNVPLLSNGKTQSVRLATGAIVTLPGGWSGSADYTLNKTWYDRSQARLIAQSQVSQIIAGTVDIVRDLSVNPIAYQLSDYGGFSADNTARATTASVRLAGPLPIHLPGGKPTVTIQAQRSITALSDSVNYSVGANSTTNVNTYSATYTPARSIKTDSGYFEARVPVFGERNHIPFVHALEFQLAGRYERYSVSGPSGSLKCTVNPAGATLAARQTSTGPLTDAALALPCPYPGDVFPTTGISARGSFNPTYSVKWAVARDLTLRASFANGYRPPDANLLVPVSGTSIAINATDPLRGNELIGTLISPFTPTLRNLSSVTGGNPNVRPEHSTSYTAGFILTPQQIRGLRFSVDWSYTRKTDNYFVPSTLLIGASDPTLAGVLNDFIVTFPERFTRTGATGAFAVAPITLADLSVVNASWSRTGSVDFALDYGTKALGGRLDFSLAATWLYIAQVRLTDHSAILDYTGVGPFVSQAGGPEWRGQASLRYTADRWSLGVRANYFDGYYTTLSHTPDTSTGLSTIPTQVYFDVFGSYNLFKNTELSLGARNVFNKRPPYDGSTLGYSRLGDARRGTWYLNVKQKF